LNPHTGNFPLRTLIGILMTLLTRREMGDLRNMINKGIRESTPQSQNLAKVFDVQKGKDEKPADFLHRLKENIQV
jgi:hypothetical protein